MNISVIKQSKVNRNPEVGECFFFWNDSDHIYMRIDDKQGRKMSAGEPLDFYGVCLSGRFASLIVRWYYQENKLATSGVFTILAPINNGQIFEPK